MSRQAVECLVLLLLVLALVLGVPVAAGGQATSSLQTPDGFDRTTFRVTVYENGSATWSLEHRTPLANESQVSQFQAFARDFERNQTTLYTNFVEQAEVLTDVGTNATGRQMEATDFQRSASVDPVQSSGTVEMSFRWTNFAVEENDRIVVSDVFDGGFYIGPSQSIVFERGPGLAFVDAQPTPDSMSQPDRLRQSVSVTWNGEQSFNDRRPYVELAPAAAVDTQTQTSVGSVSPTPAASGGDSTFFMGIALVFLVLGLAVGIWWTGAIGTILGRDRDGGSGPAPPRSPDRPPDPPTGAQTGETGSQEPAVSDEELLTDSDRVLKLLEENGGRMKQVNIVDSTDWSKSKVSMLLSDMEDEGTISKLRVGRENIISLAGEEPDAAGSPFDEE